MKILRISSFYTDYWKNLYKNKPYLEKMPYLEQLKEVFSDFFSQSDSYSYYLSKMGYESEEIISNIVPLQRTWAKENNAKFDLKDFQKYLPIEYIKKYKPDILFLNDYLTFNNEWINHVKTIQPSIKLVISWCSTDISNLKLLEGPDLILTSTKPLETWFRKEGLKVELLRHAFDKRVIDKIDAKNKNNKISFIGTLQRNRKAYDYRCNIVESLIRNIPIDIYSPYVKGNNIKILIKKILYDYMITLKKLNFKDEQIKRIPLMNKVNLFQGKPTFNFHDTLSKNIIGNVYGINMFKIMSSSLISLNVEANVGLPNSNYTGNIRVFEATGVGSCLLTDWKEDINELYDPDYEIITYKSIPECIEKAKWLLDNPTKCIEIGKAGQKRTLKDHTYKERCIQLDCIIKKYYKTI